MSSEWSDKTQTTGQRYKTLIPELDPSPSGKPKQDDGFIGKFSINIGTSKGRLTGLSEASFAPPQVDSIDTPSEAVNQSTTELSNEETGLMIIVRQMLGYRDSLIDAQAGNTDVDVAALQRCMTVLASEAAANQARCAAAAIVCEPPDKGTPLRDWKISINSRYTRVQKVLAALNKVAEYLMTTDRADDPVPITKIRSRIQCNWTRQQELEHKIAEVYSHVNTTMCDKYVKAVQQAGLKVIPEVYAFLACPSWENHTLSIYGKPLSMPEIVIPLQMQTTSAMLYNNLTGLYLCNCRLADEHMCELASILPALGGLRTLALRENCITCIGAAELGRVLPLCKSLHRLLLDRNEINAQGAYELHKHLRRSNVHQISVSQNNLTDVGVYYCIIALLNPLRRAYATFPTPTAVHELEPKKLKHRGWSVLSGSMMESIQEVSDYDSDGDSEETKTSFQMELPVVSAVVKRIRQIFIKLIAVFRFMYITSRGRSTPTLLLESTQLTHSGVAMITYLLRENLSITVLDLRGNTMRDEGAVVLAAAFPQAVCLKDVDVADNEIGERGIEALMRAANQSSSIESIDLSGNGITGTGSNWITSIGDTFYIDQLVLAGRSSASSISSLQLGSPVVFKRRQLGIAKEHLDFL